jgi:hypothetical protein
VTVTATPASSKSGGGGVDLTLLVMLAGLWAASWARYRRIAV